MKAKLKAINPRVLDIVSSIPKQESVDAHWDSYNDSNYHDTHNDSYDDYGDNSYYHDEYRDSFVGDNERPQLNPRVLDVMNSIPKQESVDAHWDSYNDSNYHDHYNDSYDDYGDNSYYHDEYRDSCITEEHPKIKTKTYNG